ncbi:hypothetical protein [Paludisphaera sp.]|uniref:hypothetical protein n=1 Tax=Paludisphaera sp. TaxID=2017432 RepID=UPI00301E3569
MPVPFEEVLASMPPDSQARIAEAAARLKAAHRTFLELQATDTAYRETPEFRARLAALPEEYRVELLRQEAGRAGIDRLRKQVEALGGKLRITAEFPGGGTMVIDED